MNTDPIQFTPAVKEKAKLRMAIAGPSGSGKTYTSLLIASNLGFGKIALIDTEHGSASKYADLFQFDTVNMHKPFNPLKLISAIEAAQAAEYGVLIIDSLSHVWNGPGGLLEMVDNWKKKYSGNTYAAWSEGTPIQNALIESITGADMHIIGTMRSKTEYILVESSNGKTRPQKVGMAPVQRDGFEYEFDVLLEMDIENYGIVTKTRCPALTGQVYDKPGPEIANILSAWLNSGVAEQPPPTPKPVAEQPPEPVKAEPSDNGQLPDINKDPRAWLEAQCEKDQTLQGRVWKAVSATGKYTGWQHAKNAMTPNEKTGNEGFVCPKGFKIEAEQKITCAGAMNVYDWLMERKEDEPKEATKADTPV